MRVASRLGKGCSLAAALGGVAVVLFSADPAEARTERQVSHRFERVWPTAVRFLRVDQGYPIREKDADVGYVLFEVKEDGESFRGSLELVRGRDAQRRPAVKIILHVEGRPAYVERMIVERLLAKIRDEHGDPPPAPEQGEEEGEEEEEEEGEKKSGTARTWPPGVSARNTFSGLRSRCTMPSSCAAWSGPAI